MNTALILNPSLIRPFALKLKLSRKAVFLLVFFFIVFLVGFYIFQVNAVTQASFAVATCQDQIASLNKESKNLEINFSGLSALSNIEMMLAAQGYEKADKIYYIRVPVSTVAVK